MNADLHDVLSLLFVTAISAFCFVRFLSLRCKLLCEVKKQMPDKYGLLLSSCKDFTAFIKTDEDTGNNTIDVLRIKTRKSLRISFLFLIVMGIFFIAIVAHQFI
jgi:hypothetical protein